MRLTFKDNKLEKEFDLSEHKKIASGLKAYLVIMTLIACIHNSYYIISAVGVFIFPSYVMKMYLTPVSVETLGLNIIQFSLHCMNLLIYATIITFEYLDEKASKEAQLNKSNSQQDLHNYTNNSYMLKYFRVLGYVAMNLLFAHVLWFQTSIKAGESILLRSAFPMIMASHTILCMVLFIRNSLSCFLHLLLCTFIGIFLDEELRPSKSPEFLALVCTLLIELFFGMYLFEKEVRDNFLLKKRVEESEKSCRLLLANFPDAIFMFTSEEHNHNIKCQGSFQEPILNYTNDSASKLIQSMNDKCINNLLKSMIPPQTLTSAVEINKEEPVNLYGLVEKLLHKLMKKSNDGSLTDNKINEEKEYILKKPYRFPLELSLDLAKEGSEYEFDIQGYQHFKTRIMSLKHEEKQNIVIILTETTQETLLKKTKLANELKNTLICTISHELRTPLNGILGSLQILKDDTALEYDDKVKLMDIAIASSMFLCNKVNDMLDFSELETGLFKLHTLTFDLKKHLNDIIMMFHRLQTNVKISLKLFIQKKVPKYIHSDSIRLGQILQNILNNAIKYTREGEVKLKVNYSKKDVFPELIFSIMDTGIGMDKKTQEKLFQMFWSSDDAFDISTERVTNSKLSGLGLTISQKLCNSLGGNVTVKSKLNKGSKFKFNLPLSDIPLPSYDNKRLETSTEEYDEFCFVLSEDHISSIEDDSKPQFKKIVKKLLNSKDDMNESSVMGSSIYGSSRSASGSPLIPRSPLSSHRRSIMILFPPEKIKLSEEIKELANESSETNRLSINKNNGDTPRHHYGSIEEMLPSEDQNTPKLVKKVYSETYKANILDIGKSNQPQHSRKGSSKTQTIAIPSVNRSVPFDELLTLKNQRPKTASEHGSARTFSKCECSMVLIVDDHDINRLILKGFLNKKGINADEAVNGKEALEKILIQSCKSFMHKGYNLILMDLNMPIMGGLEATYIINQLKQEQKLRNDLTVIAVTAHTSEMERNKCTAAGMKDFLVKPVIERVLMEAIDKYLV